jgi:hypothetical protein
MSREGESAPDESSPNAPTGADANTLWQRWTADTGPFYQSCVILGFDHFTETNVPRRTGAEKPDLQFCSGALRLALRHIPVLLLLAASTAFVIGQMNDFFLPFGTYLPLDVLSVSVQAEYLLAVPLGILWLALLARIFRESVGTAGFQLHRTLVFYVTALVLAAGVAYSLYLVVTNRVTGSQQHLAFRSGYFLFILIEGHLVYDGLVLRGENLFWNLKDSSIVDSERYETFRSQLTDSLAPFEFGPYTLPVGSGSYTVGPLGISSGILFAVVLLGPTIPLPMLTFETSHPLLGRLSYGITVALQIFLVAILFQFVVLLWQFSKLLSKDYIDYKPFHPDEHGGYRALGRFATRVNLMLAVGGGYVAFRFVTGGLTHLQGFANKSGLWVLTWVISFLGPMVVYAAVVVLWVYFSFWRIHRQMRRGRREKIQNLQRQARDDSGEDTPSETSQMADLELDAPVWESLQSAPVWPIKRRSLLGVVLLDTIPIFATLLL